MLLGVLAGAGPAVAQPSRGAPPGMDAVKVTDPLDGQRFEVFVPTSTNGLGGYDSDGCSYARGEQARGWTIVTSPTTLYSAPLADWKLPIPQDRKTVIAEMLLSVGRDVDDARAMSAADRYELAAAVARELGRGDVVVGELYLTAAWTVRDTIVGFLPGVHGAADAGAKLSELVPLARAVEEPGSKTRALFDMARLAHRGGFVHERDDFLALLDDVPDAGLGAVEKRAEFRRRVEAEGRLLSRARDAFKAGLDKKDGHPEDRARLRFLIGDLTRRLGDLDGARTLLEGVSLDTKADEQTAASATDVLAVLKVQAPAATVGIGPRAPSP